MTEIKQVRLSGLGGQGIVLSGMLLGQAGVMEGKYIAGSNSYGAQARGSGCKSEIVFSDSPINYPHLTIPDVLVAMSQGSYDFYSRDVREEDGLILYDGSLVKAREVLKVRQLGVPATEYALKKLRNKQVANIVILGTLVELTKIVSAQALEKALVLHISRRFRKLNLRAFRLGMELGRKIRGRR
jgi:2-oxoglutarate ferredoxin oxidoreductase subunit gamma